MPPPSPILVGRIEELRRLEDMLGSLSVALVYGVGGVGKSALVYSLATRYPGLVLYENVTAGQPLATLLDDARRQLSSEAVPQLHDDGARLRDLAERLDARQALWVLDDLHWLDAASRLRLVEGLGHHLTRGRLLATSRELVPVRGGSVDRFELRLGGLDEEHSRRLWENLDTLYGSSAGFGTAWTRGRGNPFHLRRAHAGGVHEEEPLAASIRALSADQRLITGLLALAAFDMHTDRLEGLLPDERLRTAVRELVVQLIVEVDGGGRLALHDLYRDALRQALRPEEQRALHARLAELVVHAQQVDPVVRLRERCHHLCACGRFEEAGRQLLESSGELLRLGAAGELLRGIEAIPADHRTLPLARARARLFSRMLDVRRAYEELTRLSAEDVDMPPDVKTSLAGMAMLVGELEKAEHWARAALEDPQVTPALRRRAENTFAITRTYRGFGDEARGLLETIEHSQSDPDHIDLVRFMRAYTLWLDGRPVEAEEVMRGVLTRTRQERLTFRTGVLGPLFQVALLAACARFEQAEALLRHTEAALHRERDPRIDVSWHSMHAMLLHERGDRELALEALKRVEATFDHSGELLGALWARAWMGRELMVLGRREEAERLLTRTEGLARGRGIGGIVAAVARARREDPLARLALGRLEDAHPAKRGEVARSHVLGALLAVSSADAVAARAAIEATRQVATGADYGLDRALAWLAEALLARREGQAALEREAFQRAEAEAVAARIDPGLLSRMADTLGGLKRVTARGRAVLEPSGDERDVVIDARLHELRHAGQVLSFKQRPVLRKLLYALASHPGEVLTKELLVERTWNSDYNPLIHNNQLWVNMSRLREVISTTGLSIDHDESGYLLRVPGQFVYIARS